VDSAANTVHRLILLLGTPRSGTTWLASLLNSHRGVVYSHEPMSRLQIDRLDELMNRMKQSGIFLKSERDEVLREWCRAHHEIRRPPFFPKSFLHSPAWAQLLAWVLVRVTGHGEPIFRYLFSPSLNRPFDLLIKDIDWSKHTESLVRATDPIVINIVRHPCAVAASLLRGQRLGLMPGHDRSRWLAEHEHLCMELGYYRDNVLRMQPCEFLGLEWLVQNVSYSNVVQAHQRSHLVVYEDLCREPLATTACVFDFLGWKMEPQTLRFIERSTQERKSRLLDWLQAKHTYFGVLKNPIKAAEGWKTELTDDQKAQVLSIAGTFPRFKEFWSGQEYHLWQGAPGALRAPADHGRAPAARTLSVSLQLDSSTTTQVGQPFSVGLPFPVGALRDATCLELLDAEGRRQLLQTLTQSRWPDGSVRWLLLDSLAPALPQGTNCWQLRTGAREPAPQQPLHVHESAAEVVVDTGAAVFHMEPGNGLLGRVRTRDQDVLDVQGLRIHLAGARGELVALRIKQVVVEDRGPVRATVRLEGASRLGHYHFRVRLSFFASTRLVRLRLTLHNPRRAQHVGGLWDLGDPGSLHFRELALELGLAGSATPQVSWATEPDMPPQSATAGRLEVYQDSSGGKNWQSKNHVNRMGQIPVSFCGYRVRADGVETFGSRASPVVTLHGPDGGATVVVPEFWQQFPKALEVEGRRLRVGLFPRQFADLFELQGGEQKTHTVWLDFHPAGATPGPALDWVHQPALVYALPNWYASTGVLPFAASAPDNPWDRLETYLSEVIEGDKCMVTRREVIDEYGWRNYGEVYADHELAYFEGPLPLISHYNNQYDLIYGTLLQFLRTGYRRWFEVADPLARHVVDIDIYHTERDKAAYNGGLFWHTDHYRDAATCSHRAFSRANSSLQQRAYGGGPSNEHNYTTGLLLYFLLTGDCDARDAVTGLADFVLGRDRSSGLLRLLDDGPSGLASCTAGLSYQGPGRGAGNSVNALLDAWQASGRRHYLEAAEMLIQRCIHPADDVAARDLLNVERRWSYTVFLWALVRYLGFKREVGEVDERYAYAQASLLAYARWMLEHERPYFDQVEKLEYPTETWAAQELRKANVLRAAAGHADEPLRSALLQCGAEFAERAWKDLLGFESRQVARAVALVLLEGTRDAYLRDRPVEPQPRLPGPHDFGQPEPFVAQKVRVLTRLRTSSGLAYTVARLLNPRRWWHFLTSTAR
jgi:hypothetical protein